MLLRLKGTTHFWLFFSIDLAKLKFYKAAASI